MTALYLGAFVLGLVLAVRVMMFGVERPRSQHPRGERSFRASRPAIVTFLAVFGIVGSLIWTRRVKYCYGLELVRALQRTDRGEVVVLIAGGGTGYEKLREIAGGAGLSPRGEGAV